MSAPGKMGITLLFCLLVVSSRGAAAQACIGNSEVSTTEDGASAVFAADLNGDGATDLVVGTRNSDTVAWYENDGAPTPSFIRRVISLNTDHVDAIHVDDVDGDGDLDVLSASRNDSTIAWYESSGGFNPVFTKRVITSTAASARSVYTADFDLDGDTDVVSASYDDDTIAWYENDGGSPPVFTERVITTAANGAASVYAADVNGDGAVDIVSASVLSFEVAWYQNSGGPEPVFTRRVVSTTQNRVQHVRAADLDGDGDLDLLCASTNEDTIAWFRNPGGPVPVFFEQTLATGIDGPTSVATGDLDTDGDIDVFASCINDDTIYWFENLGGSAPSFSPWVAASGANGALSVEVADMNADGFLDFVSASANNDTVLLHRNLRVINSTTASSFSRLSQALGAASPGDLIIAEIEHFSDACDQFLNYFGKAVHVRSTGPIERSGLTSTTLANGAILEAAVGQPVFVFGSVDVPPGAYATVIGTDVLLAGPVFVGANGFLEAGPEAVLGGLPSLTERPITTSANGARAVAAGDLNGDGAPDIVSADEFNDEIVWYRNTGGLSPSFVRSVVTSAPDGPSGVHLADIDRDGDLDIVSCSLNDSSIAWYQNSGGATPTFSRRLVYNAAMSARSVFTADLDDDGDLDILSASYDDDTVAWFENDGAPIPTFTRRVITNAANGAASVYAADVDGDGDIDVLSAAVLAFEIAWYESDGSSPPSFVRRVISVSQNRAEAVSAADLDNDGDIDILSASTNEDVIAWFDNDGGADPAFVERTVSADIGGPVSLVVADLDRDGDSDIVTAALTEDVLAWFENDGARTPQFVKRVFKRQADAARSVAVADFDGDSDLDIVGCSSRNDVVSWYQNGTVSDLMIEGLGSGIVAPGELRVVNKGITIEETARLRSLEAISVDRTSNIRGRGVLEAPSVAMGGLIEPAVGSDITILGEYAHFADVPATGRQAGLLRIAVPPGSGATALDVQGTAQLGGGLIATTPDGLLPVVGVPLSPLLTADTLHPERPRFDIVLTPVLSVLQDGEVFPGTLVPLYSEPGDPGEVRLVPITLEELLFSPSDFDAPGTPNDAVIADVSGSITGLPDGVPDLIIAVPSIAGIAPRGAVAVLFGDGSGASFEFGSASLYVGPEVDSPVAVEVGDFNYDGRPEIAFANRGDTLGNNDVHFLIADTTAPSPIQASPIPAIAIAAGFEPTDLGVGEILLIGFERDDLIIGLRGSTTSLITVSTFNALLALWDSCDVNVDDIDTIIPFDNSLRGLGQNRLAATSPATNSIRVFSIVNGDFDNATFVDIPTGVRPAEFSVARLDSDEFADLAVLCRGDSDTSGGLTVIRGLLTGFAAPVTLPLADPAVDPRPTSITVADLDSDLDLDLVVVASNDQGVRSVRELRNVSDPDAPGISFTAVADTPDQPDVTPLIVLASDLDSDNGGLPDDVVVLVDPSAESRGAGPARNQVRIAQGITPCSADVNGNGTVDFFDLALFISFYNISNPVADIAAPFGVWNFFDVAAYIGRFNAGCP